MRPAVRALIVASAILVVTVATATFQQASTSPQTQPVATRGSTDPKGSFDSSITQHAQRMIEEGRRIFRFDTFGDEAFWGDQLELHRAIVGEKLGGVGPGLSPKMALSLGLKVDAEALPADLVAQIKAGKVDMNDPASTVALLKANAVVGVTAFLNSDGSARSVGIQCALCHSTVDDSFAPGIGRRLDGWPNRDLNVGEIVALAPTLKPFSDLLGVDDAGVRKVLKTWGPGKYDAELVQDGKAARPDGRSGATVLPAAFGLAGVNLHTYSGWGGVPYWNAYVANTQMHGKGTFFDPRLNDKDRFPVAAKAGHGEIRNTPDLISSKLAALQFYQLAIPAPAPPAGSFNADAAKQGETLFGGQAKCATCHVPPLFTEPGWPMHKPEEMGIDNFQAERSPDRLYRTTPLRGLFTRQKGGFYHDGRFATLDAVVDHYNDHFKLGLTPEQKRQLVEYLKSL
jgi:mono/diheme cytochrome c family protein